MTNVSKGSIQRFAIITSVQYLEDRTVPKGHKGLFDDRQLLVDAGVDISLPGFDKTITATQRVIGLKFKTLEVVSLHDVSSSACFRVSKS